MPRLTCIYPDGTEVRYSLEGDLFTVGRAEDNSIALADERVSSHHAVLNRLPGGDFMVTDVGATNPTRVNGRPVQQQALHHGDNILFGEVYAAYENERIDPRQPRRSGAAPAAAVEPVGTGCFALWAALAGGALGAGLWWLA